MAVILTAVVSVVVFCSSTFSPSLPREPRVTVGTELLSGMPFAVNAAWAFEVVLGGEQLSAAFTGYV